MDKICIKFSVIIVLLCIVIVLSFFLGHYQIDTKELFNYIFFNIKNDEIQNQILILTQIRLPRILTAILIGSALAISGALFQGIFMNPLVSPSVLGVLSGASFGASLAMIFKLSLIYVQISAFLFGFLAVFFALMISKIYGKNSTILMLILGGIISSSLFGAGLSFLKYIADPENSLPSIVYWMMGSLALAKLDLILKLFPFMILAILGICVLSRSVDLLSLGEDDAKALGLNVKKVRIILIILATFLSACAVMLGGIIAWVGLVVPHICRFIVGVRHAALLPFSALFGALFLLSVDTFGRTYFSVELPIGILVSMFGIPIFLVVLKNTKGLR
ncbi:FecCD family ABC transporter permease [Campylobacter sp. CN_NA1]|uniref:FecCD family ABC transporter permease n=1 Tax=Campylobacter sp. CN_NA1 TaxID=2984150 RepID=UPI0022EA0386|nr:iron ABC transporter permease [Campylobacter sp. CN_NA1]MDA3056264.1 iron ABC transporter permease [Campylobacter sp. CN_NA1]